MKLAKNIEIFELPLGERQMTLTLVWDDQDVVLIDTGLPGQSELIEKAIMEVGFSLQDITKVIITHQDMDHIGNAKLLQGMGRAKILAHEIEVPYLQGDKLPVRLARKEAVLDEMTIEENEAFEASKKRTSEFYFQVDEVLQDDQVLDICGGIKVFHTPGHMPGHISLLLCESNLLIAGDACTYLDQNFVGANPEFTLPEDMPTADKSFERLLALNVDKIICYHGGVYSVDSV